MESIYKPINVTSSTQIGSSTKRIQLGGIIVNSHTTGTFKLVNGTATGTAIAGTYTPASGSSILTFEPIEFDSGCFLVTAGTINVTLLVKELGDVS